MKAIIIEKFGGPENLVIKDVVKPQPKKGEVTIAVKAFGLNHAEVHMRRGEWAEWVPISGIECVGVVEACPGGEFEVGSPVAAFMGGMGRSISGSYAQYTQVPITNVVSLGKGKLPLSWEKIAAIPESYSTAWWSLFKNLEIQKGQTILIRGGTSNLGQAAINLAVDAGLDVTATSRKQEKFGLLKSLGANETVIEGPDLLERLPKKFDHVLNLVGNSVLLDSLKMLHRGGRLCHAGWLGGLEPLVDFNPLLQMASGVHFSMFGSFEFGKPEFLVKEIPLNAIIEKVAAGKFKADPYQVFDFEDIVEAHRVMESGKATGKLVVKVE
jgi:NADPH2:quinone reductase